ncbi:MAG: TonB family protein [Bacteroidales bacterium]|nr:TonB family protein [Bacteroidales bacterium]
MRSKVIAGISTAVFVILVIVLLQAFGYNPPDPPIPEEGVEINVGDFDFGMGSSPVSQNEASSQYAPPSSQEQTVTQETESSLSMPSNNQTGSVTHPDAVKTNKEENKEPEINKVALFPGNRSKQTDGKSQSQGAANETGNQGKEYGTTNTNNYAGNSGRGNWTLAGRRAVSMPEVAYNSNVQGTVVIRIWVNQRGEVVRAEYEPKGSTTSNGYLVQQAKQAALQSKFNASTDAPDEQNGTITYTFKI